MYLHLYHSCTSIFTALSITRLNGIVFSMRYPVNSRLWPETPAQFDLVRFGLGSAYCKITRLENTVLFLPKSKKNRIKN